VSTRYIEQYNIKFFSFLLKKIKGKRDHIYKIYKIVFSEE